MDAAVLEVRDLVRAFGDLRAVAGVSLRIDKGETYGLLGPNGAGKTTTINVVAGLLRPDEGTVWIAGAPLDTARKHLIGLVPQDIALYPDLSAVENLRFFGRLQGMSGRELNARIDEVLEVVGLRDRAKDRIDTYSGGMKRRANIAVGLLHRPQLLILDEPTVGVDPQSRNSILEAVAVLGASGMAVLYTTHYMEEAERLCERVGIIDAGRLIAEGTPDELVDMVGEASTVKFRVAGGPAQRWLTALRALPRVSGVHDDEGVVSVTTSDGPGLIAPAVAAAAEEGLEVVGVDVQQPDLEAVFLHLTGKALRD